MSRDLRALALVAGLAQFSNLLLHPLPYETLGDGLNCGERPLVGKAMYGGEDRMLENCRDYWTRTSQGQVTQDRMAIVRHETELEARRFPVTLQFEDFRANLLFRGQHRKVDWGRVAQ